MSGGIGFYGKLPGAGDFVQRRLPADFVGAWDRHFQRAVETGRRELGERWTTAWRHGAAWRFVLAPQVCGNGAWCGVTGPSVDRLGRAFPMVLAAQCAGDTARVFGNEAWFDALERVYRSAQDEAVSVETFDARVAALPRPLAGTSELSGLWRGLPWDSGQWRVEMPHGAATGMLLSEAWAQLCMRPGAWCLWWTEGATHLLATRGLPRSHATLLGATRSQGSGTPQAIPGNWLLDDARETAPLMPRVDATDGNADAMLWLDGGHTLVISADDGPHDSRRTAARGIREAIAASAPDPVSRRTTLMSLHTHLRQANQRTPAAANENGAALVVRFDGSYARLLRVGAAALWHWRRGQLQASFVERMAGSGGEFDDLLFGEAWLDMPGIGTPGEPDCDEAAIRLEPGDRLLLLVTRQLLQLPRDWLVEALSLPTCEDARVHLAMRAGLGVASAHWPLAVVEVRA